MDLLLDDFKDPEDEPYSPMPAGAMLVREGTAPLFPGNRLSSDGNLYTYQGNAVPHWVASSVIYHVCFRLEDSVPSDKLQEWVTERNRMRNLVEHESRNLTVEENSRLVYLFSQNIEYYLASGYGSCLLKNDKVASIVKDKLEHDNGRQYQLHAWCIMPNHVHVIYHILDDKVAVSNVIQAWKSVSAHEINQFLERKGKLWRADYYNHIIRSREEYIRQVEYVWNNPGDNVSYDANRRWRCDRR